MGLCVCVCASSWVCVSCVFARERRLCVRARSRFREVVALARGRACARERHGGARRGSIRVGPDAICAPSAGPVLGPRPGVPSWGPLLVLISRRIALLALTSHRRHHFFPSFLKEEGGEHGLGWPAGVSEPNHYFLNGGGAYLHAIRPGSNEPATSRGAAPHQPPSETPLVRVVCPSRPCAWT